ncbi:hypothetical protein LTR78_007663 [Recurvomyces mirabilis]|uniref:F-box domain-containing protein n=1 Tax=Recurvomyces mirabilis TaxID=574656 RepID=A0AAE0TR87_9PEZI|nr:hypothetical protein LTR78_007663 [Recurvomyces mirabilis]KAK5151550.1 hypothetical protein LTS14_009037 [Recurvomyces mirabilis]
MSSDNPTISSTELLAGVLAALQTMQRSQLAMHETQLETSRQISELVSVQKRSDERIANFVEALAKSHNMMPPRSPGIHGLSPLTAGKRLTDTFELLEHILMLLDPRDIMLHSQRVNRIFRATVTNSAVLQRRLFLRADYSSSGFQLNPFIRMPNLSHRLPVYYTYDSNSLTYIPNQRACQLFLTKSRLTEDKGSRHLDLSLASQANSVVTKFTMLKGGSWKRMYLTQPPCLIKVCVYYDNIPGKPGRSRGVGGRMILKECTFDGLLEALAEVPLTPLL